MQRGKFLPGFPLIIRDLPCGIDPQYLGSYLNQAGTVLSCRVEGTIGFVNVESENAANLIIAKLNYSKFNGNPIRIIKYDDTNRKIIADCIALVIVRGLTPNIEASEVHRFFSRVGEVINVQIPKTDWGSLGFAFVQYKDISSAHKAVAELTGFRVGDNVITVDLIKKNGVIVSNQNQNIQVQQPNRSQITAKIGDHQAQQNSRNKYYAQKKQQPQPQPKIDVALPKQQGRATPQISVSKSASKGKYEITI